MLLHDVEPGLMSASRHSTRIERPRHPGSARTSTRADHNLLAQGPLGAKTGIVSKVEIEVSMQDAVGLQGGPSSATDLVSFVGSFPAELNTGASASRAPPVDPTRDNDESEFACVISAELDEGRSDQV